MKLNVRFALLIGALLAGLVGSILLLHSAHQTQTRRAVDMLVREQGRQLDQLLNLTGYPLQQFARDYSLWDDMVRFVESRDPAWAEINLQASVDTFHLAGVWVLDREGGRIYSNTRQPLPPDADLPVASTEISKVLAKTPFSHFFAKIASDIYEFQAAPIQPSGDIVRSSEPKGWVIAARRWDDRVLQSLAEITHAQVSFEGTDTPKLVALKQGTVDIGRALRGLDGAPIARLRLHFEPEELVDLDEYGKQIVTIVLSQGVVMVLLVVLGIRLWVVHPFRQISDSLTSHDPAPLQRLAASPTELGHIARLVREHFQAQAALKQNKESLDRALDERVRLGRALHDNVIQAIFATGMGLSAAREMVRSDPAGTEQRLDEARAMLNETIREVRGFIVRLELDSVEEKSFRDTIEAIAARLSSDRQIDLSIDVDNELADRLSIDVKTHALETIRDTVRSGLLERQASRFRVELRVEASAAVLRLSDNGQAVDPANADSRVFRQAVPGGSQTTVTYPL